MTRRDDGGGDDLETLRARLAEAQETLLAIRHGEVDAVIIQVDGRDQVYTLSTADRPYRDLVEQMQEGAVVLAASGDILYCNARFAALVGAPLESVIGTRVDRFAHVSDRDSLQALLTARDGKCHSRLMGSDGHVLNVSLSLSTTVSENIERLNLIVTDLSEILEAHSRRDRAERDNRMKDEFLSMLAHELRNPLSAINNAVQVLELDSSAEAKTRARRVIGRQVVHLSHLVDDLVNVDRVVSGKIKFTPQPFDVAEVVSRAVSGFTGNAGLDRYIDVSTEPAWVNGDAVRLEQVLSNLLTNAIKYSPAASRIQVALRGDGANATLTVEDAGIGISPDLLPSIFDTFVQGDRTLDRTAGGLGIGLTLVRGLVEMHGGTVDVSSDGEGLGCRFTVRLPQIPAEEGRSAGVSPARDRTVPRRVLLIDDALDLRQMLRMVLELRGHVVFDAADGGAGLVVLEAEHPDVAIIDIGLPGMDGYEVARRIREHPSGRAMLLLALTGYGSDNDRQRSAEAGFDHHLVKPFDSDALAGLLSARAERVAGVRQI